MAILNLIRWKNLCLIILTQLLLKYALFESFNVDITLNGFGFLLLIIATICLAAAGNIINDIYDTDADLINKPEHVLIGKSIKESTAYNLFIAFNIIGVSIGFYLSHLIGKSGFFAIFVIISGLLYIYATYLKQLLLIGNIVISMLVAFSIIIVGLFDLLPVITIQNQQSQLVFFKILLDYALFAFVINLIREIVKDMEDVDGDYKAKYNTLPIALGRERANIIIFILSFLPILGVVYYVVTYLYKQPLAVGYFAFFILAPMIYFTIKTYSAKHKNDYTKLSIILKLIMFFGIISILLYPFILK